MVLPSVRTAARFLEERVSLPFSVLGAFSAAGLVAMVLVTGISCNVIVVG